MSNRVSTIMLDYSLSLSLSLKGSCSKFKTGQNMVEGQSKQLTFNSFITTSSWSVCIYLA